MYLSRVGLRREAFISFNEDIEEFYSEVEGVLSEAIQKSDEIGTILTSRIVNQLVFLFASVINEIQNGPTSDVHRNIARTLSAEDRVLTFNWDTLMDRALTVETVWEADSGYLVSPRLIYRDEWVASDPRGLERSTTSEASRFHKLAYELQLDRKWKTDSNAGLGSEHSICPRMGRPTICDICGAIYAWISTFLLWLLSAKHP